MYLTSLFEVLPQQVTLEDIREVETLPRKYKKECEEEDIQVMHIDDSNFSFTVLYLISFKNICLKTKFSRTAYQNLTIMTEH